MTEGTRWSPGMSYGPILRPTDLYLLNAKLEIHPILTHSFDAFHLDFNLATGETIGFNANERDRQLLFTAKNESATLPRVTEVIIISRSSPWCTIVHNEDGVSLADVCGDIWREYTESGLTEIEFSTLSAVDQERIKRMALVRESGGYTSAFAGMWGTSCAIPADRCKRIDWLRGKVYFDGLEHDDEFAKSRLGFAAPNVLKMTLSV
ncbi:hypothetical protein DFH11DRAFT_755532 [Phellopilus nigrolimitatus]|nr:hypothetical protein DFH11DRAFT_755532 [Phellopilus nigrolimitatus]